MRSRKVARYATEVEGRGPTAQTLKRIYNCESPETLFIQKAQEVVLSSKAAGPPFDPFEYAKYLNIDVEEHETMTLDGTLTLTKKGKFVIHLKKYPDPLCRKRFTLAHELAHTFFYEDLAKLHSYRRHNCVDEEEEEELCNIAANELLMPSPYFQASLLKNSDVNPETVLRLRDEYEVSLQAIANRCARATHNLVCSLWKQEGHAINLEWVPRVMKDINLILCQTGRSSIETAFKYPGEAFTSRDSFYKSQSNGSKMIRKITSSYKLPLNPSTCSPRGLPLPDMVLSIIKLGDTY